MPRWKANRFQRVLIWIHLNSETMIRMWLMFEKLLLWFLLIFHLIVWNCNKVCGTSSSAARTADTSDECATFRWKSISLTLPLGGGLLKPPLNKNRVFGTFLWSKCPEKIWLFPNIYDNASHTLSGSQNGLKTGFYSIFVIGGTKIRIRKCGFLAFLGLKWTQLVSKTQN